MKLVRIASDAHYRWIETSEHDPLFVLLRDMIPFGGNDRVLVAGEALGRMDAAVREAVHRQLEEHVPTEDETHVVEFESRTLRLNVRRTADRLIGNLVLILGLIENSISAGKPVRVEQWEE
jgi:hypothetical protein